MKLIKYKPKSEPELHDIIEKHLDEIEEGLILIKHEFMYSSERPDFLCVDKDGRLVIIEVKVDTDKDVIFQGIRYFEMVNQNKYLIQKTYPDKNISPKGDVRILIISGDYTTDSKNIIQYLEKIDIKLFIYNVFKTPDGKDEGIIFQDIDTPISAPQDPLENYTLEKLRDWSNKKELNNRFDKIIEDVKKRNIHPEPTKTYVAFKYHVRNLGGMFVTRNWMWLISWELSVEGSEKKATQILDGDEDLSEIYKSFQVSMDYLDQ